MQIPITQWLSEYPGFYLMSILGVKDSAPVQRLADLLLHYGHVAESNVQKAAECIFHVAKGRVNDYYGELLSVLNSCDDEVSFVEPTEYERVKPLVITRNDDEGLLTIRVSWRQISHSIEWEVMMGKSPIVEVYWRDRDNVNKAIPISWGNPSVKRLFECMSLDLSDRGDVVSTFALGFDGSAIPGCTAISTFTACPSIILVGSEGGSG